MTRISPRARMGPCHVCGFNGMRRQMTKRDGRWVCRKIPDCTDRVMNPRPPLRTGSARKTLTGWTRLDRLPPAMLRPGPLMPDPILRLR